MDTLTHAISGAVLGRATAGLDSFPLSTRRRMAIGFMAAAFPDIDYVLLPLVDPVTFLGLHRGVTHSLILLPLWAWLLAWICARLFGPGRSRDYFPLIAMALAIHIAADIITAYGTMIFAPFSNYKAAIPTTFIIDIWFSGILLAGLVGSLLWRSSRLVAVLSLVALAAYVGFQGIQLSKATRLGEQYVREQGLEQAGPTSVTALPQPLSPFNWKIIITSEQLYHISDVNLRRTTVATPDPGAGRLRQLMADYRPPEEQHWHRVHQYGPDPELRPPAREAWYSEALAGFRQFAQFPRMFSYTHENHLSCAWFLDLRFILGNPSAPARAHFQYGVCRSESEPGPENDWRLYRYGDPPQPL